MFKIYTQVEQKGINKTLNFWLFAELDGTKLWTIDSADNLCMAKNEQSITHEYGICIYKFIPNKGHDLQLDKHEWTKLQLNYMSK